jgi:hypothetical protein
MSVPLLPAHVASDAGHGLVLAVAALLVCAVGLVSLGAAYLERRGVLDGTNPTVEFERWWNLLAVAWSAGAAAVHFAVIGEHFLVAAWEGVAFAVVAWFQLGWAGVVLVRPSGRLALAAVVVNLGVIAVWVWTRVLGQSVAGAQPEPVGTGDAIATAFEIALVLTLAVGALVGRQPDRSRLRLPPVVAFAWSGSALAVAIVLGSVGIVQGSAHDHAAGEADAEHSQLGEPGTVAFGSQLAVGGGVADPTGTLPANREAVWIAVFSGPTGGGSVELVVLDLDDPGGERELLREDVAPARTDTSSLSDVRDLAALDGPGRYRVRYERAGAVLAEGDVTLTP